jgi:hypothetical protein
MKEANELHPPGMLYNNVVGLLRNPMLYGAYQEVEDFVEKPFMTRKEWERMQGLMTRNDRDTERLTYTFAGLITCGCCGLKMAGTHTTKNTKKGGETDYKYYRCRRAKVQGSCSNKGSFNEEKLEQDLMEYVKASVAEQIVKVKEVKQNRKPKKARRNNRESIELQLDKLEDLYISDDRMTKEKYEAKKAAILAKLIVDDEPEEKLPELADLEKIQTLFDSGVEDLYRDFSPEERREFWRGILSEIRVEGYKIVDIDFIE